MPARPNRSPLRAFRRVPTGDARDSANLVGSLRRGPGAFVLATRGDTARAIAAADSARREVRHPMAGESAPFAQAAELLSAGRAVGFRRSRRRGVAMVRHPRAQLPRRRAIFSDLSSSSSGDLRTAGEAAARSGTANGGRHGVAQCRSRAPPGNARAARSQRSVANTLLARPEIVGARTHGISRASFANCTA
jgi:hypothetical protein